MFETLSARPADSLLSLIKTYAADPRANKIDLGVGVYRDEAGRTPVFAAVKAAERRLVDTQDSKSYLGPEGDAGFVDAVADLALSGAAERPRHVGLQTPGGTGALRLLLELYTRAKPDGTIWLGLPSWPVHESMLARLGAKVATYSHFDRDAQRRPEDALLAAAESARAGDLMLLHGCCHNPTGADIDAAEWAALAEVMAARGVLPLVDLAYHGLGRGLLEDAGGLAIVAARVPEVLLAYSCDKNFGVYRDRVGGALLLGHDQAALDIAAGHLAEIARNCWSMPPDHGGAVVRSILADPALRADWNAELDAMRDRLNGIRARLAARGRAGRIDLSSLGEGRGMFALLPLSPDEVQRLREQHAIYMAGNGRINIAGLALRDCDRFADALATVTG